MLKNALKVGLIGLGRQNIEDHLPAIINSEKAVLDCVCDLDLNLAKTVGDKYDVACYSNLDLLLNERKIDFAVVALPHNQYLNVIKKLAHHSIHILKEKPFAISLSEAKEIDRIITDSNVKMMITLQRRFNPIYTTFLQLSKQIGEIYNIDARYTLNINNLEDGWRANKAVSGGGALLDMGYHIVDLLIWYFGLPSTIFNINGYKNKPNQEYDVEDSSKTLFQYNNSHKQIMGSMFISRIFPEKSEKLTITGTKGIIVLQKGEIQRLNLENQIIESLSRTGSWPSAAIEQIDYFCDLISSNNEVNPYKEHMQHQAFIEACYLSDINKTVQNPQQLIQIL